MIFQFHSSKKWKRLNMLIEKSYVSFLYLNELNIYSDLKHFNENCFMAGFVFIDIKQSWQ